LVSTTARMTLTMPPSHSRHRYKCSHKPSNTWQMVKDIGADIQAEKKKETILLIVSLVLMIVPFVAEVGLDVAGLTALARFAVVAGEVGNAATAIAEVIDNPESAPFAVMSILAAGAAGKGGKTEATFADAAKARKLLPDVGAMGKTFKEIDDKVQSVMSKCSF
jgi:chitinase